MSPGSRHRTGSREHARLEGRKKALWFRARMLQSVRAFFLARDYLEVETPLIIPAPPPEPHIDAIRTGDQYLHTSPELCMKRLLSAGYDKIFQICKCFRSQERGDLHLPEFTLLEWYRAGIDYRALMEECEALFQWISKNLGFGDRLNYQGLKIELRSVTSNE